MGPSAPPHVDPKETLIISFHQGTVGGERGVVRGVAMADTRWLEKRRQTWFAVVYVPPRLHGVLGKKLRRSLQTRDLRVAQTKRHIAVAEFKTMIDAARRPAVDKVAAEAASLRETLGRAKGGAAVIRGYSADATGDELDQETQLRDYIADRAQQIADDQGDDAAHAFIGVATGRATPLLLHVPDWLREGGQKGSYAPRTKLQLERDLCELKDWLITAKVPATVEAITRRMAARFVTEHLTQSGRTAKTLARIVSSCRAYWTWLARRALVEGDRNPWDRQAPPKGATRGNGADKERAFTDAELTTLLNGPADAELADLMRVAALSGMRIEEIYQLTVRDCAGGNFNIRRAKTQAGVRVVPIHPDLAPIVARRSAHKAPAAWLFDEAGPQREGRERSMAASKRFGHYRRGLEVAEMVTGKRRSLVNFHSLRRWFITAALRAGQPERVVQQVVGHKPQGVTLGIYFAGDLPAQLRACVEAVRLPNGTT